jgi:hypothetical protein
MTRCAGLAGLIFGHNFQPRFDGTSKEHYIPVPETVMANLSDTWLPDVLQAAIMNDSQSTYQGDVCARCGEVRRPA